MIYFLCSLINYERKLKKLLQLMIVDTTLNIYQNMSVKNLVKEVENELPADTLIPSESTVLLSFVPKKTVIKKWLSCKSQKCHCNLKCKVVN